MKLEGLIPLYKDMKAHDMERCRFPYKNGRGLFDVMFFIDENPFCLIFGAKGKPAYFEVPVRPGFEISPMLDREAYQTLVKILGIEYAESGERFKPSNFFKDFNAHIPEKTSQTRVPKPHDIAPYRRDVEEADKIYFIGWRDNKKRDDSVSRDNLIKTRKYLGEKAYRRASAKNFSSCWSDQEKKATEVYLPD